MKIQIIEAFKGGHHTNYIDALLPTLRQALSNGDVSEVLITISKAHYDLMVNAGIAIDESCNIQYLPTFPNINPNPNLQERLQLFKAMMHSIATVKPDAIIMLSADYDVMINAIFSQQRNKHRKGHSVGVFHYGYPTNTKLSVVERIKQYIYDVSWRHASWDQMLMVNPVVFEELVNKKDVFSKKISLLPDPMPSNLPIAKVEARKKLGIPHDGIYLGFVGMMDKRKALPELLSAFNHDQLFSKSRLLLAGEMDKAYIDLMRNKYQHLIDTQKIIIINRHLSKEDLHLGYSAIDVITVLQYRRFNLSANLLKAVSYDKPIVADDCGYTGMMTKRFQLGYLCHVNDQASISKAMLQAVEEVKEFKPSPQSQRLKLYHDPSNYANTIMSSININHAPLITWDWVCAGLSQTSLD